MVGRVLTCRFSRRHGTARGGTARYVRAVPTCRFSTCRLGTYSKARTKASNILVKLKICLKNLYCILFTIPSFQKMLKKAQFRHWTKIISMTFSSNSICTSGISTEDFIHKGEFSTHNWQSVWHDCYHYYEKNIYKFQVRAEMFLARHGTRHDTRATCRHACRSARENPSVIPHFSTIEFLPTRKN